MATGKPRSDKDQGQKAEKKQKLSIEQRLMKAMSHPLRFVILDLLNKAEMSPRMLERELGEGLSQVSYHVKVLFDFELIEMTRTEPRRGAVEHFYRAVVRAFIPSGMAKDLPKSGQNLLGNGVIGKIERDVATALKSGTFYARDDWHASWTPVDFDGQGCENAEEAADEYVEKILKIAGESANRQAEADDEGEHIWTTVAVLIFGSEYAEKELNLPPKKKGRKRKSAANENALIPL